MVHKRARSTPPLKCGDAMELRCLVRGVKGLELECRVFPRLSDVSCARAVVRFPKRPSAISSISFFDIQERIEMVESCRIGFNKWWRR